MDSNDNMLKITKKGRFQREDNESISIADNGNIVFQACNDPHQPYLNIHLFYEGATYKLQRELPENTFEFIEHYQESEKIYLVYIYNWCRSTVVVYQVDIELKSAEKVNQITNSRVKVLDGYIFQLDKGQVRVFSKSNIIPRSIFENIDEISIIHSRERNLLKTIDYNHDSKYYAIPQFHKVDIPLRSSRLSEREMNLNFKNSDWNLKWSRSMKQNDSYILIDYGEQIFIDISKVLVRRSKMIYLKHQPKLLRIFQQNYLNFNELDPKHFIGLSDNHIAVYDITTAKEELIKLNDQGELTRVEMINGQLLYYDFRGGKNPDYYIVYQVETI